MFPLKSRTSKFTEIRPARATVLHAGRWGDGRDEAKRRSSRLCGCA